MGGISERAREINRRRHRRKKLGGWKSKLDKATVSEKQAIATKIRDLTPGCDQIIANWNLEKRER